MTGLARRDWVAAGTEDAIRRLASRIAEAPADAIDVEIARLVNDNRAIHDRDCINLNPATNTMNPKAERLLSAGLSVRPSLGYPGAKYEMGLEAISDIEVITQELAAEIFEAKYVEYRVASGAMSNLYAFMAVAKPGDAVIVPPAEIGGHVTHHRAGAAGLYGLAVHEAAVNAERFTVDLDQLRSQSQKVRPKLITVAGSLNLLPHPLAEIRSIADEVDAKVLYDAAHMSGMIAGRAWQQPLAEGAHLMTMSTYKSLGGPPAGLVVTNDAGIAERLEAIAFPGLTANFDVGKTAALAMTLLDWKVHGRAYASAMATTAKALATELERAGLPVHGQAYGFTTSQQLALEAARWGGGQAAAMRLRRAHVLASGIGLPIAPVAHDMNGLRLGTPEIARWGMGPENMEELASYIARALSGNAEPETVTEEVSRMRRRFTMLRFIR
jgi:glycine hydroxymethyltransferase